MLDLLIKNAVLTTTGKKADIAIDDGKIVEISGSIDAEAHKIIDAADHLVSPPFIDPHFHMDATLSLGLPRLNESGTLLEGIQLWGELKPHLTLEALKQRAHALVKWSIANGTLAIRSHVDTSDASLLERKHCLK